MSAALCACSGGGSTGSLVPHPVATSASSAGLQNVRLSFRIPRAQSGTAASSRHPLYISPATQSALIAVNGGVAQLIALTASSPNCQNSAGSLVCTATISAPAGTDTFTETMYATTNGTGAVLSETKTSAVITAGKPNTIALTLDGVVAAITLTLADPDPPTGAATQVGLTVTFTDAAGEAIVGGAPFANAIALGDSDQSGNTSLSQPSVSSPTGAVSLYVSYTGRPLNSATFTGSASGATPGSATLTPSAIVFNDYANFGYDNQHDVFNPNTVAITPSSVANGALHLAWQTTVNNGNGDFLMQSQPVLATEIPSHAGVLYVGGGSGNVYAYDALTGNAVWSQPAFTGSETYLCDPSNPNNISYFGVGGSVAYDPTTRTLFIVGNSNPAPNEFGVNQLFHLDGATGAQVGSPINFGGTAENGNELNFSHTSVTLSNGVAYVGTGATCDIPSWRGRIAAINTSTGSVTTFFTVWNPPTQPWGGGGVWGWGGVSLDFNGNVVAGIGNTDNGESYNGHILPPFVQAPEEYSGYGESVMQISPDLSTVMADNHPIPLGVYGGQAIDLDVEGTPAIFKPLGTGCTPMTAVQSKSGALFVYNEGQINAGPTAFQLAPSTAGDGFLGDPAFSPDTNLLYAPIASDVSPTLLPPGLIAISTCPGTPAVVWHAAFGPDSTSIGFARSVPAVSAGGVVFMATSCNALSGLCPTYGLYSALWMLDASTGAILNNGNPILYTNTPIRAPVTIDGDWIYVLDQGGDLYGLTINSSYAKIAAKRRSPSSSKTFVYPGRSASR